MHYVNNISNANIRCNIIIILIIICNLLSNDINCEVYSSCALLFLYLLLSDCHNINFIAVKETAKMVVLV